MYTQKYVYINVCIYVYTHAHTYTCIYNMEKNIWVILLFSAKKKATERASPCWQG